MVVVAAILSVSSSWGYLLPAIIGLESMGVPSPGETALVLAAVLASQGKLQIGLVIAIGAASAIIGDNIGYLLGRKFGREVLEAPGPFHTRRRMLIAAGDRFFNRHGGKAVLLARWVALVRVAAAWLAGINHMRFRHFFLWNALGGITWATTFGLAGYFGGSAATKVLGEVGLIGAALLIVTIIVGLLYLRRREKRAEAEATGDLDRADSEAAADLDGGDSEAAADLDRGESETAADLDRADSARGGEPVEAVEEPD
jgi:membrane protein DedA with SNARE-associated domain